MYYKHSGHFSVIGLLVAAALGCAAALLLGFSYSRGLVLITDEKIALVATIAFGCLLGVPVGYGLVWGKVRNQPMAVALPRRFRLSRSTSSLGRVLAADHRQRHLEPSAGCNSPHVPHCLGVHRASTRTDLEPGQQLGDESHHVLGLLFRRSGFGNRARFGHPESDLEFTLSAEVRTMVFSRSEGRLGATAKYGSTQIRARAIDLRSLDVLGPASPGADNLLAELDSCPQCRHWTRWPYVSDDHSQRQAGSSLRPEEESARASVDPAGLGASSAPAFGKIAMAAKLNKAKAKSAAAGKK